VIAIKLDLGDVVLHLNLEVPGLRRYKAVFHVGAPFDTTPEQRNEDKKQPRMKCAPTGKKDLIMDLMSDKGVTLSVAFTDENENPVPTPDGTIVTWTVEDPDGALNFTDNGDGSATALATGELATADVHMETDLNGKSITGDLQIVVVAGLAERAQVVASEPFEVTPDA
jgi:hypothetical protein